MTSKILVKSSELLLIAKKGISRAHATKRMKASKQKIPRILSRVHKKEIMLVYFRKETTFKPLRCFFEDSSRRDVIYYRLLRPAQPIWTGVHTICQ